MAHGHPAGGFGDRAVRLRDVIGNSHLPFGNREWLGRQSRIPRHRIERSVWTSRRWIGGHRRERGHRELHHLDIRGSEGDR